jgi:hypothetical protein
MARGYSSARPWVARREDSFRNARRRKNCSSLNDQCLAEKAIRTEREVEQPAAMNVENGAINCENRALGAHHDKP